MPSYIPEYMQIALLGVLPVALFIFGMSAYNLYHGGVLVTNKGWKTKEEAPVSFWVSVSFPFVMTLLALWGFTDPDGFRSFLRLILDIFGLGLV